MCLTLDTSFIFTKKSNVAKGFFDIYNAEMAQWHSGIENHEIWTFKVNLEKTRQNPSKNIFH